MEEFSSENLGFRSERRCAVGYSECIPTESSGKAACSAVEYTGNYIFISTLFQLPPKDFSIILKSD